MPGLRSPGPAHTSLDRPPSGRPTWREHGPMADVAFAVLLIAGFLVLALTLRGLEKL
jgi:hypothetical protein